MVETKPTVIDVGQFERHLEFWVPLSEVDAAKKQVAKRISQNMKIPGFRSGKAPLPVVERHVGSEHIEHEAMVAAVDKAIPKAVVAAGLGTAIGYTKPSLDPRANGVNVTLTVTLAPQLTDIPDYQGQQVVITPPTPTEEQFEHYVDLFLRQFGYLTIVDQPAETGNLVSLDLWQLENGERVEPPQIVEQLCEIGSSNLTELEETLLGIQAGERRIFQARSEPISGSNTAEFEVLAHDVRQLSLPELTDDWVAEETQFGSADELFEFIHGEVELANKRERRNEVAQTAVSQLVDQVDLEVPETLIEHEMNQHQERLSKKLAEQGHSLEQYLAQSSTSQEDFRRDLRMQSLRDLRRQYLLNAVAREAELEITSEEIQSFYLQIRKLSDDQQELPALEDLSQEARLNLAGIMMMSKAESIIAEAAVPVDQKGNPVDLSFPQTPTDQPPEAEPVEGEVVAEAEVEAEIVNF